MAIIWRKNAFFFHTVSALFIIGLLPFFLFDKVTFLIMVKQWHHPIADVIAPYLTWLGDGLTYGFFVSMITLLGISCRKIMITIGSFGCMSIVVQLLKRFFFIHDLRPILLVPTDANLHIVDGVELLTTLSFPSGHSGTIFALVSVIQLLVKKRKKIYSIALLLLALAVAYSRMYLCQHFYTDVYVGGLIGTVASIVVYLFCIHFHSVHWLDRSAFFFIMQHVKNKFIKE
ncbi:phosphatase PAP2 family protein [Cardinium endosymbiont of Tipula unca]|uniref:phosphatase PAP2 family protein n=1 Tax=Cardinium endosymbiont of Tipula unca TaxID=3066216 RepID=UPI0030CAA501